MGRPWGCFLYQYMNNQNYFARILQLHIVYMRKRCYNYYTMCNMGCEIMECSKKIKELRESTGMNRKEFCEYFQIPYRTVTEWERDNRHAPKYVLRLLEYYIRMEKMTKDEEQKHGRKNGVDDHR